jgi:hypothetical protein
MKSLRFTSTLTSSLLASALAIPPVTLGSRCVLRGRLSRRPSQGANPSHAGLDSMIPPTGNPAGHFVWAAFFKRIVADWEGFGAKYRYTPSLIGWGLFFSLVRLIQERLSVR